ncbi:putative membrane protein YuiD [Oceanobacillus oncorhynchi subsp. incaldanensis]|uniref:Divergent PAP2 family protein n=2 Tax=Oceanobacillus TaxID=182709 RepID=A0A0A1MR35_9BACI|nr:divergent PAP2 family protein [Oceanobacillus oncorhynchi]MDM8098502.1 divergent PAP2 family protein [Oceanobacillus oncorhynchi]UUI38963.1 divergent PAP2 family protein [Oceanobacillus oncorhynchi]GIO19248.1 putative membrane protein YuiD [Oceanobacillus oncorhynchi subsp. incaldanensis]CEI81496.1 Divergent PAP2 family protein [Oceanobacillus oncorhynchi]
MTLLTNFPLWAALIAIVFAQVIKIPIKLIFTKEFQPGLAFSTGGMPSSHSAAVTSLATAVGIAEGVSSSVFALACIFSVITMFDASGVRRQAGEQAIVINQLVRDFQLITSSAKDWSKKKENEKIQELKELLGHQPIEVFFGAITGIIIAFSLAPFFSY